MAAASLCRSSCLSEYILNSRVICLKVNHFTDVSALALKIKYHILTHMEPPGPPKTWPTTSSLPPKTCPASAHSLHSSPLCCCSLCQEYSSLSSAHFPFLLSPITMPSTLCLPLPHPAELQEMGAISTPCPAVLNEGRLRDPSWSCSGPLS